MTTVAPPKHRVIQALRAALQSPNPVSAVQLVTVGMEELHAIRDMTGPEKLETLKLALRDVATGADGVENTSDDMLHPETLTSVLAILDSGLLGDMVDALLSASRGQYAFGKVFATVQTIPAAVWKQLAVRVAVLLGGCCMWRAFR
jgi:hypothetical protein